MKPSRSLPEGLVPIPTFRDAPATKASDVTGVDLSGRPSGATVVGVDHWTLLLFLSSGCEGCREIWGELAGSDRWPGIDDVRAVVVTRDPASEDTAELRRLAVPGLGLIMSDAAYAAYRVYGPPFFVLVDGSRSLVVTEGVAWGASRVAEDVARATARAGGPEVPRPAPGTRAH